MRTKIINSFDREELVVSYGQFPSIHVPRIVKLNKEICCPAFHKLHIMLPNEWPGPSNGGNFESYDVVFIRNDRYKILEEMWQKLPQGFLKSLKDFAKSSWVTDSERTKKDVRNTINNLYFLEVNSWKFESTYKLLLLAKIRYRIGKMLGDYATKPVETI